MPSNPVRTQMECRLDMKRVLDHVINQKTPVLYNQFVLEIITKYAVTEGFVDHFVQRFYIDTYKLQLKDGELVVR